ncbi:unnamed protein product [Cuscuta campestris]|uniref:SKP1 component POZ domain-containing protein n=1 Tax=Cuscuta campestris TaxID=132261 RepID=A0A484L6R0_9ASTE|nr:unnamed protein product [Cuscuta campestris]
MDSRPGFVDESVIEVRGFVDYTTYEIPGHEFTTPPDPSKLKFSPSMGNLPPLKTLRVLSDLMKRELPLPPSSIDRLAEEIGRNQQLILLEDGDVHKFVQFVKEFYVQRGKRQYPGRLYFLQQGMFDHVRLLLEAEGIKGYSVFSDPPKIWSTTKKINLKSSDGEVFEVDGQVAVECQTIKQMIEDDGADSVIPLPKVNSKILAKVIEYCKRHAEALMSGDKLAYKELKP